MLGKGVRYRFYAWPIVLMLGVGFALANGLGWACGNLRQYLLHGLHMLDPTFLAGDWFTTQTKAHHGVFNAMLVACGALIQLDWMFVALNALFATVLVACIYAIAAKHYRYPLPVCAIAAYLFHFAKGGMLGWSCIVSFYFQPSTVGAVCLLAGLTCLAYGRWTAAGWTLFAGAMFHVNYMVWIVVIAGGVTILNLHRIGIRQAIGLIAPIGLAVVFHVPFIAEGRSTEQLAVSAEAARILHDIYMPCHSRPLTWGSEPFMRFAAMMLACGIACRRLRPAYALNRTTWSILATIASIVTIGAALTAVVQVDAVALLFPYRLVPFLLLAAEIAIAGAVVRTALRPNSAIWRTLLLWAALGGLLSIGGVNRYALTCLATLVVVLYAAGMTRSSHVSAGRMVIALTACVLGLALLDAGAMSLLLAAGVAIGACTQRQFNRRALRWRPTGAILLPATIGVPLVIAAFLMRVGADRKDFMGPTPTPDEQLLYAWCRDKTETGDSFVIPPVCAGFRLGTGRAVVIDWKCMPILPRDTVEWYHRLADVCGGRFDDLAQASNGYCRLTAGRAARIAETYHARYVVTFNAHHTGDLSPLPCVYHNPTFSVHEVEPRRVATGAE